MADKAKSKTLTEKETYREYIQKNKQLFKAGNVFSDDVLVKAFGIAKPKTGLSHKKATEAYGRFNLHKLSVQRKLNELLHQRGLRLVMSDYVNYKVLTAKETSKGADRVKATAGHRISGKVTAVSRMKAASMNKTDRAQELRVGAAVHGSRWKKMSDKELDTVKWYYS